MRWLLALCVGVAIGFFGHDRIAALAPSSTARLAEGPANLGGESPAAADETDRAAEQAEPVETTEGEAATPRQAVAMCVTCHGLDGIAKIPVAPHLAGESRVYLETQLKAFRTGKRQHEMMSVIAEGMSDADIKAAAKWYSAIEIAATAPE